MLYFECATATATGRRTNNQDNYFLCGHIEPLEHGDGIRMQSGKLDHAGLFAVADGMGGESAGDLASFLAVQTLQKFAPQLKTARGTAGARAVLSNAVAAANGSICENMKTLSAGRMGSTLVALCVIRGQALIANVGDSRAYLLRKGVLSRLTKDHTEGQTMLDAGVLTEAQLRTHPSRNRLTRHLGIFPDELTLEPEFSAPVRIKKGDVFMLVSDGVHGPLDSAGISALLANDADALVIAGALVDAAAKAGSTDNMTVVVIRIRTKRNIKHARGGVKRTDGHGSQQ